MRYFFLYTFNRIFTWSKRSEPTVPMLAVVFAFTVLTFFNVVAVLSLVHLSLNVNVTAFLDWAQSRARFAFIIIPWALLVYSFIKLGRVEEKAFCESNVAEYRKRRFRDWHIFLYVLVSLLSFVTLAWFEGAAVVR
jgi:hypothetical protein